MAAIDTIESFDVHSYICNVVSRVLCSQAELKIEEASPLHQLEPASIVQLSAAELPEVEALHLPRLLQSSQSRDFYTDVHPLHMSDDHALAAAIAESMGETLKPEQLSGSPSSTDAHAEALCEDAEDELHDAGRLVGQVKTRPMALFGAVSHGLSYVENKLIAVSDAWDGIDNFAEMQTQRLEDKVKVKAAEVKVKAAAISDKSRSTYQAMDSASQKYSYQLGDLVNCKANAVTSKAMAINDKSRSTYQAMDSASQKYSQQLGNLVNCKANVVTSKAKTISQAATLMRSKTGEIARGAVPNNGMLEGLTAARGKVLAAFGSGKQSSSRGGA